MRSLTDIFIQPLRQSLLARIVLSFLILSTLIVLFLVIFSYLFFIRGYEIRAMEQMSGIVSIKVEMLDRWMEEQKFDVLTLSRLPDLQADIADLCRAVESSPAFHDASAKLRAFFADQAGNLADLKEIFVLSADGGRVVFSTNRSREGQYRALDDYFIQGMKGLFIQNVHPSPITLQPVMTISAPITGQGGGAAVAVLAVNLDLDSMDRIVQEKAGLGEYGEAYLVDRYNVFVSSDRYGSEKYPRGVHSNGIDEAVAGRSGAGLYDNYDGIPVIGVYRWIPERSLALIAEIPQSEAFKPVWIQNVILIAIGFAMVLIAASGVYLLARKIAAPIIAVRRAALKVSGGDLSAQAPVLTADEIGELAKSFNLMTTRVKDLYDEQSRKEEYFRSLIESSTDIITIFDSSMRVTFASPAVTRILGYLPEELAGVSIFSLVHPEDAESARRVVEGLRLSPDAKPIPFVVRIQSKSGGWKTLEITGRNLLDLPAVSGIVLDARDITARRQLEERLLQAQKMEAVGRLAGGIAHDFNNLLTAVLGYSEVLLEEKELGAVSRGFVTEIKNAAMRAASLTQQLLAYSRKQMLQMKTVDVNALVTNMRDMLQRLIGEDVELVTHMARDPMLVRADPHQLEQVIMNLTLNARDAMPSGGTIVLSSEGSLIGEDSARQFPELGPGRYVVLAVSDTGVGMDEDTLKKIFDPFFTTKGIGKGTGLGLSTSYGIVKQSGGHITASSELGRGSTFKIFLPASSEFPVHGVEMPPGEKTTGSESILVVEDEEAVRKMIEMVLTQAGYAVHSESGPPSAIRYAQMADRLDFLITDVILPGMSGKSMADAIMEKHPGMKVLFISGYTEDSIVQHGVLAEGISFLQKPFQPRVLAAKVREILDTGR